MVIGRKKKALIHIAKDGLHLDEESYRQILKGVAGVESSAQLTKEGFEKVMKRFQDMGFKGLLPDPYQPAPKGRLIPFGSPQGLESITLSQQDFISYLLEKLNWDDGHYHAFCQRIVKKTAPLTKRDGQKIIIGLMAILRKKVFPPALPTDPGPDRGRDGQTHLPRPVARGKTRRRGETHEKVSDDRPRGTLAHYLNASLHQ